VSSAASRALPITAVITGSSEVRDLQRTLDSLSGQGQEVAETVIVREFGASVPPPRDGVRICIRREAIGAAPETLGAVLAGTSWLLFLRSGTEMSPEAVRVWHDASVRRKADLVYASADLPPRDSLRSLLDRNFIGHSYLVRREAFWAEGGLPNLDDGARHHRFLAQLVASGGRMARVEPVGFSPTPFNAHPDHGTRAAVRSLLRERSFPSAARAWVRGRGLAFATRHEKLAVGVDLVRLGVAPDVPWRAKRQHFGRIARDAFRGDRLVLETGVRLARGELLARRSVGRSAGRRHPAADTLVLIIARDRLTPLRDLLGWLERIGQRRIAILDNDSAYPPLLQFYEETPHQVLPLGRNLGHEAPWRTHAVALADGPFIVTDPDVVPTQECPDDAVDHLHDLLERYPDFLKVGFGLKIDDLPASYPLRDDVIAWESQFWSQEVEPNVYSAPIDTTFALYRHGSPYRIFPALRTGEPYVARHLSWYADANHPSEEDRFYGDRASQEVHTWGTRIARADFRTALAQAKRKQGSSIKRARH
jgi:hypothetical protein